jgi:hypothetical protein
MLIDRLEPKTDSAAPFDASRLFEDAYRHINAGINIVQEHKAESITVGLVLCSIAAAVVLRGRGAGAYSTVAQELKAFNATFAGDNAAGPFHDVLAHILTLKNPATPGGELRGAICQSVAEQKIMFPGQPASYDKAIELYQGVRGVLSKHYGYNAPPIPEQTLKKWFYLSDRLMDENFLRWGGVPRSSSYSDLEKLLVKRKWSKLY